jgi:hypothetical protein
VSWATSVSMRRRCWSGTCWQIRLSDSRADPSAVWHELRAEAAPNRD